jgi:hypothetical protein
MGGDATLCAPTGRRAANCENARDPPKTGEI